MEDLSKSQYWNEDLAPTSAEQRTWGTWHLASLWIGMSVCIPTYMLGASLIASGMSWLEAMLTITLGNLIVLIPMILNGHPGTRYGIPFPVLVRSSFGLRGSNIPAILRAVVACGWFGIQTWIGGKALYELAAVYFPGLSEMAPLAFLGINAGQLAGFLAFWLINMFFIWKGTESIKTLEALSAPFLIFIGVALLWIMATKAGGLGVALDKSVLFSRPSIELNRVSERELEVVFQTLQDDGQARADKFAFSETADGLKTALWLPMTSSLKLAIGEAAPAEGAQGMVQEGGGASLVDEDSMAIAAGTQKLYFRFQGHGKTSSILERSIPTLGAQAIGPSRWSVFFASLTAMVGFWATLSLNIPDFTRFSRNQRSQVLGQAFGLPPTMALYSFIGIAVTCASIAAFQDILVVEDAPWDPVALLARDEFRNPLVVVLSMLGLSIATLTTNIAANVVSPANDISNLAPRRISFKMGGYITGIAGILILPWKLIESTQGYIFTWLIGYGALLGPIGGIMIADYWVLRRRQLPIEALYRPMGDPVEGTNPKALIALILGVLPNVPGFLAASFPATFAASVPGFFQQLYTYAWFVGFFLSFIVYIALGRKPASR